MAAPVEIENPNWHRSELLLYECEWKQGNLGIVNREGRRKYGTFSLARDRWYPATRSEKLSKKEVAEDAQRLPLVGIQVCSVSDQKRRP
jgi:hypothetical protein